MRPLYVNATRTAVKHSGLSQWLPLWLSIRPSESPGLPHTLDRLTTALADRYTIEREIGSGGMATVYLAHDVKHDRKVAVKVLRPELAAVLGGERFLSEIKVTANLQHPHILPLHDSGEADFFLYYVMPFVEGQSLREKLTRDKQLSIDEALRIGSQVADALGSAHRQGVVHRDIKPENILLREGHALVADFGIALAVSAAGGERLTETGLSLGTPAYMSPEQAAGDKEIDARSDVYSLGCVLYEMLAGEPPYTGPTAQAVIAKKLSEPTPRVSVVRRVPTSVQAAIDRALEKAPADRFATAEEFVEALKQDAADHAIDRRTRAPRFTRSWLGGTMAVLIVAMIAAWLGTRGVAGGSLQFSSLATLPVVNYTSDPTWDDQLHGLTAELIDEMSVLTAAGGVSQRSLRAVVRAHELSTSLPEIAGSLRVEALLEPTLVMAGDTVRISVALVDRNGAQLWTDNFESPSENIRQIFGQITQAVAIELGVTGASDLAAGAVSGSAVDSVAYRHYLRGRTLGQELERAWRSGADSVVVRGLQERTLGAFAAAIERDSSVAPAWAELSEWHFNLGDARLMPYEQAFTRGHEYAARAVQIDPGSPRSQTAAAWSAWYEMRWNDASRSFEQALTLNPNEYSALKGYAILLANLGLSAEAVDHARRLVESDPGASRPLATLWTTCFVGRDYACAVEQAQTLMTLDPLNPNGCQLLARALAGQRHHDQALEQLSQCPYRPLEALIKAMAGDTASAREFLRQRPADRGNWFAAYIFAHVGELDSALAVLEEAIQERGYINRLPSHPDFDPLHGDPRFDLLLRRMSLECDYHEDGTIRCRDINDPAQGSDVGL